MNILILIEKPMGTIIKKDILFDKAGEYRTIHIYLPDGYYESDERYPVMYMWDGQNMFRDEDATYKKSWGIASYMDHAFKKTIVVGMQCASTNYQRCNEYCPYALRLSFAGQISGEAYSSVTWLTDVVKPYIDTTYRTWWHREATGIGGSSMGGMISLYAVLRFNNYFSKAAVVSPAVSMAMHQFKKEIASSTIDADTRIFFSWGENEWSSKRFEKRMNDNIITLRDGIIQVQPSCITETYRQEGGSHNEASWERQVPMIFRFLWE